MVESATSQSVQDYLKAVYQISRSGNLVSTNDIADALDVAPASVTGMLKRLSKDGYVDYTPRQGVELTRKGLEVALEIIRHHRLLESFFVKRLGMDWATAHAEAEILEHYISEELETLIDSLMGYPEFDPQGAPIPKRNGEMHADAWPGLFDVPVGVSYVIRRVRHDDPALLQYVERLGLVPGTRLTLVGIDPFEGPVEIEFDGRRIHIGHKVAGAVFVERVTPE